MKRAGALFLTGALLVGCSSSRDDASVTTVGVSTTAADTTAADTTAAPAATTTVAPEDIAWESVQGDANCECSDGSAFNVFVRTADPTKVVLYFEGGGACFSAELCGPGSNSFKRALNGDDPSAADGIFDFTQAENPFRDYSFVYVPYCTGDVHLGTATHDYGNGVVIQHKGRDNASFGLQVVEDRFPDAATIFVTGSSAGGVPAPLYAGLAADHYPDARIVALADGSGVYPDNPGVNAAIGALWGAYDGRPDWPEAASLTPEQWSIPGLFTVAGTHAPGIVFARHDHAFDEVQANFTALAGLDSATEVELIDGNAADIEAEGVPLSTWVAPGTTHTILMSSIVYTQEVNGVRFIDWLTDLAEGRPVDDVHCTVCN